jgi:hypothetical protein
MLAFPAYLNQLRERQRLHRSPARQLAPVPRSCRGQRAKLEICRQVGYNALLSFRRGDSTVTERKPLGTTFEPWIEAQIRVAMEQGAFDNLPGAGKPIPSLGQDHDPDWWVKQLIQREQVSILPPSLELLRKVEKELALVERLKDEATVRGRIAMLNAEIARFNATVVEGPPTGLSLLDIDQVVAQWRRSRSAGPR